MECFSRPMSPTLMLKKCLALPPPGGGARRHTRPCTPPGGPNRWLTVRSMSPRFGRKGQRASPLWSTYRSQTPPCSGTDQNETTPILQRKCMTPPAPRRSQDDLLHNSPCPRHKYGGMSLTPPCPRRSQVNLSLARPVSPPGQQSDLELGALLDLFYSSASETDNENKSEAPPSEDISITPPYSPSPQKRFATVGRRNKLTQMHGHSRSLDESILLNNIHV